MNASLYLDFLINFVINLAAVTALCYGIYYRRYHDKTATTSYMLFNVFVFTVVYVLFSSGDTMSMGLGFGLFAILSLITLRSETLSKREITYFFGILSLALINALGISDYIFLTLCNIAILVSAYIIDHPRILRGIYSMNITLDHIPENILSNPVSVSIELSRQFNIELISYSISMIDYVRDTAILKISYRTPLASRGESLQVEGISGNK